METQVLQHNSEPGVDLIAQPQRAIIAAQSKPVKKGPRTQRQYLLPRPSKEVENIWILIGPRRRDRWMHVHHPRLVKRRSPRHFVPIFAAEPCRHSGSKGDISYFLVFPTGNKRTHSDICSG